MSQNLTEFLYKALDSSLGIIVKTSDVERFRAQLYAARRAAMNPQFEALSFQPSKASPASELWIVKKVPDTSNGASPNGRS